MVYSIFTRSIVSSIRPDWFVPLCLTATELFYLPSSHSALARSIFFHPFYSLSAIYPTINETSLNAILFVLLYKNRKKLVKDNLGQDFREKRKRNRISRAHFSAQRGTNKGK